jgi:hypothetical protein
MRCSHIVFWTEFLSPVLLIAQTSATRCSRVEPCDSPNLLEFSLDDDSSLVILEGVTDLLGSYDLFLISERKTVAFSYIQFE